MKKAKQFLAMMLAAALTAGSLVWPQEKLQWREDGYNQEEIDRQENTDEAAKGQDLLCPHPDLQNGRQDKALFRMERSKDSKDHKVKSLIGVSL